MTLQSPCRVCIAREPEMPLTRVMSDIRYWLDGRKLQPSSFKCIALPDGTDAIEISFSSASVAADFESDFRSRYLIVQPVDRAREAVA